MVLVAPVRRPAALAGGVQPGSAGPGFTGLWELRESGDSVASEQPCRLPHRDFRRMGLGPRTGGGVRNISSKCLYHLTLPLGLSNARRRFPFWLPCWQGREAPGVAATCLAAGREGGQDEGSTVRQTQQGEAPGANSPPRALAKMSRLLFCGPCIFPVPHPVESRLFLSLLAVCLAHHTSSPRRPGLWLPAVRAALGQCPITQECGHTGLSEL